MNDPITNMLKNLFIGYQAEKDAQAGMEAAELRLQSELGKKPEWRPTDNAEHAEHAETLGDQSEFEELRSDQRKAEDELARHPSPRGLQALLAVAAVAEVYGGVLIMQSLGRENPERIVLGTVLAMGTLGFTALVARNASGAGPHSGAATKRSWGSVALFAVYTVFVLSVAAVRVEAPEGEDGGDLATYAEAVLMVATTILPAFTAEWIFRRRQPGLLAQRELANIRKRLRELEAKRTKASKFVRDLSRERDRFEQTEARRGAAYRLAHRRASALPGETANPSAPDAEEETP